MVNHRVAQDAVEPSDDGVADLVAPVEAFHEGILDDLFGERSVADAPLDEAEKVPVVRDQDFRDPWRDGLFGPGGSSCMTPAWHASLRSAKRMPEV